MKSWHNERTDELCEAILSLKTKEECYAFLDDICTVKEITDIAQRLWLAVLVHENKYQYSEISDITGASNATIYRVKNCYEYGNGGYKTVIGRLKGEDK